jgi:hypothetical protein
VHARSFIDRQRFIRTAMGRAPARRSLAPNLQVTMHGAFFS